MKTKKKTASYQSWHGFLLIGVVIVALVLGMTERFLKKDTTPPVSVILNEETCTAAGGTYNACASACRTLPDGVPCIEVCVPVCECGTNDQCPFGYVCMDYVGLIGICSNSS